MNTVNPTTDKTAAKAPDIKQPTGKAADKKLVKKTSRAKSATVKTIEIQAKKYKKQIKNVKAKVIRDSFPFPEREYAKLSELKKTCIADGIPVKRGEILRAGLHLLAKLNHPELKQVVEQVKKTQPAQSGGRASL